MAALTKTEEALNRAEHREQKQKDTLKALERALVRKTTGALTAAGLGAMRLYSVPMDMKGFPVKLGIWGIATIVEAVSKGSVQAAAGGLSECTFDIYVYDAVRTKNVVAGDAEQGGNL